MSKPPVTSLRLYLPATWPSRQTSCEWLLLNASGARLQSGHSEPRHWPAADRCELVLTAEQCLLATVSLPKTARARTAEIIGYALEEQLLGDVANEHFVVGGPAGHAAAAHDPDATTGTAVWVIARSRLQALLATLRALGYEPQRLISELQLPPASANWTLCLKPRRGFLRTASEAGCSFDLPADSPDGLREPPAELRLAVSAARKAGTLPAAIDLLLAPESRSSFDTAQAQSWQAALGLPLHLAGEYDWRDHPGHDARNLLTGEFSPPRTAGEGWDALRPALFLAGLALLIHSLFSFGEWAWLHHEKNRLQQQMTAQFRSSFPQAQTIVDPPLQMQRLHDQLRRERGQPGSDDFLSLLAAASASLPNPSQLRLITYAAGRLELTLRLADTRAIEQLRDSLMRRGLDAVIRDTRPASGDAGVEAVLTLSLRSTP